MWSESGPHSLLCKQSQCCKQHEETHAPPWALLTAGSCREELVFAMLGTLPEASLVQTMVKSLGSGGEIPPNEFFPVVRFFFFFSRHQNYLICKYMYKSPEKRLNLSLNY